MKSLALIVVATLAGCAKILGLDDTTFASDATIVTMCDGAPQCTSSSGRSACGQLFGTGAEGGQPLRVAEPTGMLCSSVTSDGPCAFSVSAAPVADFFAGTAAPIAGSIDDCGRFVVPDIDPAITDLALSFAAPAGFAQSATLLFEREATTGTDEGLDAFVVSDTTIQMWTMAMTMGTAPDVSSGYLVRYTASAQMPINGVQVAKDSSSPLMNAPGTVPWAAYFAVSTPFGLLDPVMSATAAHGTAYANLGSGTFSLEGFRVGARCAVGGLQQVANTFIFVVAKDC